MQRDREFDSQCKHWEQLFNRQPYSTQQRLFRTLSQQANCGTVPLVLEAPTGGGKSYIALFLSDLCVGQKRTYYVCSTVNLQTQLYNDASSLEHFKTPGDVVVLYGRNKYLCVHQFASVQPLEVAQGDAVCAEIIQTYLHDIKVRVETNSLEVEWFVTPMQDMVKRELQELGVPDRITDHLWSKINASDCGCSKKRNRQRRCTCLRHVQLGRLSTAKLGIINSSIVMAYAAYIDVQVLFKNTKICVFDEAHTLADKGDALKARLPKPIRVCAFAAEMVSHENSGVRFFNGSVNVHRIMEHVERLRPEQCEPNLYFKDKFAKDAFHVEPVFDASVWREVSSVARVFATVLKELCGTFGHDVNEDEEYDDFEDESAKTTSIDLDTLNNDPGQLMSALDRVMAERHAYDDDQVSIVWRWTRSNLGNLFVTPPLSKFQVHGALSKLLSTMPEKHDLGATSRRCLIDVKRLTKFDTNCDFTTLDKAITHLSCRSAQIELMRRARCRNTWKTAEDTREIVPTAWRDARTRDLVLDYQPTEKMRADLLRMHVWDKIETSVQQPSLFMSATLRGTNDSKFARFKESVGLNDITPCVAETSFDSGRMCIFHDPTMKLWKHHHNEAQTRDIFMRRVEILLQLIRANPRGTIVTGVGVELNELHKVLVARLPTYEVVLYTDNKRRIDELKHDLSTDWKTKVLVGKESLYTGLDLPNRIGLVAVFRALNYKPSIIEQYTRDVLGLPNWEGVHYKRMVRQLQAAGRIQRSKDDSGVIALLSNTDQDVRDMLKHYPRAKLAASVDEVVFDA